MRAPHVLYTSTQYLMRASHKLQHIHRAFLRFHIFFLTQFVRLSYTVAETRGPRRRCHGNLDAIRSFSIFKSRDIYRIRMLCAVELPLSLQSVYKNEIYRA